MTLFTDFFKPEVLFSAENPFLQSAKQSHKLAFESLDKTARLQLDFARDLMDINRTRFDAMYAGTSFADTLGAHQDLAFEAGQRGLVLVDDLQSVATEFKEAAKQNASEFIASAANPAKATARKAKAA